jgi:hypothetical protein
MYKFLFIFPLDSENWIHFVCILKNWSYYSCATSMTHYAAAAIACCKPYYHGCCGCTQCGRGFIECRPKDWNFIACSVTTWEELLLRVSYKTSANHPSSCTCNWVVSNFTKTNLNVILNFSCSLTILPKVRVLIHISLQVLPTFCAG